LIKEVQEVSTGFALCTGSLENLAALEEHKDIIADCIRDSTIDRQKAWTMYRLDYVPRSIQVLDNSFQLSMIQLSPDNLSEAIRDCTGQQTVRTTEASFSAKRGDFSTSWFAFFDTATHTPLPGNLRILSTSIRATLVVSKPKIIQCTRCFNWHNARSCTRPVRCRICGSCSHIEEAHPKCATALPHICPPRCLHCGGAHPADSIVCPLRKTHKEPLTSNQRKILIKNSKASRLRTIANSPCTKQDQSQMDTTGLALEPPSSPPSHPQLPHQPPLANAWSR
jgi:hypothetical protein